MRDPFDALRDANPVPDDALPPAPMGEAERIIGARTRRFGWPSWAVATAAAVTVLATGGAWMLWLGDGPQTGAADPVPVASSASSSSTTEAITEIPAVRTTVFLLREAATGPVVVPVPRAALGGEEADGALEALLSGPTSEEAGHDLTTALPGGIDGPPIQIVDRGAGTVFVWIPQTWVDFGYPTPDGMAQIVFTLSAIDGIDGVEFVLGDERIAGGAVAGSGALIPKTAFGDHPAVDEVVTRLTYEGWMPLAFVETPAHGEEVALPAVLSGTANSIGNQIRLTLEVDEMAVWQETVTATCGTAWSECRGEWDWSTWQTVLPEVGVTGGANLIAEVFGSGVEILDYRVTPITIVPGEGTAATTVPTAGPAVPSELAVYVMIDADATHTTPGPHLAPAAWPTAILSAPLTDPPRQAIEWLLRSPLPGWEERVPTVSTAIPEGTRLLGLGVEDRIATVDLSSEFVSGGGTLSFEARLAQVVFTLTRFDEIDGVRISIEGTPTTVFGGEGVIVDEVATRERFTDLLPPILIETPLYWSMGSPSPLVVAGTADVFEATVSLALTDGEGLILWEGFATASCGTGCRGDWSIEIPYEVPYEQLGSVIVWEESARDGGQTNVREHPVWLASTPLAACSGTEVPADLPDQDGLPPGIAATRVALFEAARACDWGALDVIIGEHPIRVTFGEPPDDAVAWLRDAEERGERPMWWLAQTLRLPGTRALPGDSPAAPPWLWPSAYASGSWAEVSDADRQALLEIYDETDLDGFAEFGAYFGYRLGIDVDGTWLFFVTGD